MPDANESEYMRACIPIPCDIGEKWPVLIRDVKDYALLNGAGLRYRDNFNDEVLDFAPFFLLPSTFPRRNFEYVVKVQPHINALVHKIAHDHEFLKQCLEKTIEVDAFTRGLWNIYETVRKEGITQEYSLGMLRSDAMMTRCPEYAECHRVCQKPPCYAELQVEVNTIAAGFGHMGPVSGRIHRYVLSCLGKSTLLKNLPPNNALEELCSGIIEAYNLWTDMYQTSGSVILFLVEDVTYNICDQRFHEYELRRCRPDINVIRKSFTQIADSACLTSDKRLIIDGDEVSIVYFRSGYEPGQYHSQKEWDARLLIERSRAIKSPSIYYHLAGCKKVQQEMARPGVLEKYLPKEIALEVKELFAGLYSLDRGPEGDQSIEMAMKDPHSFVLKPQREGGGNNIYGDEIRKVLSRVKDTSEREAYILMDRIHAPLQRNYIIRPYKDASLESTISELGIFGVVVGNADKILLNKYAGHMVRSKLSSKNEGGVAAGFGALDSVYLLDE